MDNEQLSQCKNFEAQSLHFFPQKNPPAGFPAVAFHKKLISGFTQTPVHPVFSWDSSSAESAGGWIEIFYSLYPELTLPELARIQNLAAYKAYFPFENLLQKYHYKPSENLHRVLQRILELPMDLQNYLSDKKWSTLDCLIFLTLPSPQLAALLRFIQLQNFSRSQGVQALEWLVEMQMSAAVDFNLTNFESEQAEASFQKIQKARFPQTVSRDLDREQNLSLPWPSAIKPQFLRRGDRSGFEFKLFVSNPIELKKYLAGLERVAQEWKE